MSAAAAPLLVRAATLDDVAKRAGVSTATASRVVNGHRPVPDATRTRVLAAVETLGYTRTRRSGPEALRVPDDWAGPLQAWTDYMRAGGSPATTIYQRVTHVRRLARAFPDPRDVQTEHLTAWLAMRDWKPNMRRTNRASLRSFYRWAVEADVVEHNPARLLPPVHSPRLLPRPISDQDLREALLQACPRTALMLSLAAFAGLRRAEIAAVRRSDLSRGPDGFDLRVQGKGEVVRVVPVADSLALRILAVFDDPQRPPSPWLFPRQVARGQLAPTQTSGHLSPGHVGMLTNRVLPAGWSVHKLRHRYATQAYRGHGDLVAVAQLLGHARLETTQVYVQVVASSARRSAMAAAELDDVFVPSMAPGLRAVGA